MTGIAAADPERAPGPATGSLEIQGVPAGVATAVRGNIRYPFARCHGKSAHSAAVPRHLRSDAVMATARLLAHADRAWMALIDEGHDDLVFTCGIFHTDPAEHAMTRVLSSVTFSLNLGATSDAVMDRFHATLLEGADEISREHRVRFDLGRRVGTPAVQLDPEVAAAIETAVAAAGVDLMRMPTAGHDAAMFARAGAPTGIVLVRNQNGSHTPAEDMHLSDFCAATKVLAISALAAPAADARTGGLAKPDDHSPAGDLRPAKQAGRARGWPQPAAIPASARSPARTSTAPSASATADCVGSITGTPSASSRGVRWRAIPAQPKTIASAPSSSSPRPTSVSRASVPLPRAVSSTVMFAGRSDTTRSSSFSRPR